MHFRRDAARWRWTVLGLILKRAIIRWNYWYMGLVNMVLKDDGHRNSTLHIYAIEIGVAL